MLVCDDEPQILRALKVMLRDAGLRGRCGGDRRAGARPAAVRPPDAAIIDLVLPDGDGVEVCRRLREWCEMPIIVLSAIGEEDEKVRALDAGADDYVTKPFGPRELVARLEAALRRAEPRARRARDRRRRTRHRPRRAAWCAATARRSTSRRSSSTCCASLARNRGRLMTHRALLTEVWGPGTRTTRQVLRTHIANLRRKIEPGAAAPTPDPHRSRRRLPLREPEPRTPLHGILMRRAKPYTALDGDGPTMLGAWTSSRSPSRSSSSPSCSS